jgi:hypothetical protein
MSNSHDELKLDETIDESFPASDPPANTVETGIRTGDVPAASNEVVTDNQAKKRFELTVDGHTAFLVYERTAEKLTLIHTEVPPALRGRHIGDSLVNAAVQAGRSNGLRLVVVCPFARAYLRRHPAVLSENEVKHGATHD